MLKNLKGFSSHPESILGDGNLFASRDTHFLVSAQTVLLPIPKSGKAQFNPALFNYQSAPGSPAVLTILVTRQGSSIRKSDVEQRIAAQGGPKTADDKSALQKGADIMFLVQIPLKHKNLGRLGGAFPSAAPAPMAGSGPGGMAKPADTDDAFAKKSDVEQAVLGHGPHLGPFNEGHGLRLERDPKFPVRITVQFYKATSNGVASDVDLDSIARSIGGVYEHAEFRSGGAGVSPVAPRERSATAHRVAKGAARVVPVVSQFG